MVLVVSMAAGGTAAGVAALEEAYSAGATAAQRVQQLQDEQLVEGARIGCAFASGLAACASEAQLIEQGWLKPEWAERERVVVEPLELPAQLSVSIEEAGQHQVDRASGSGRTQSYALTGKKEQDD